MTDWIKDLDAKNAIQQRPYREEKDKQLVAIAEELKPFLLQWGPVIRRNLYDISKHIVKAGRYGKKYEIVETTEDGGTQIRWDLQIKTWLFRSTEARFEYRLNIKGFFFYSTREFVRTTFHLPLDDFSETELQHFLYLSSKERPSWTPFPAG